MNDSLIREYSSKEKNYREEALNTASGYFENRKLDADISIIQSIIHPLLLSYEYRLRTALRRAEINNIESNDLKTRISNLESVNQIDFSNNPFLSGRINYGLCEEFALEDTESYTLFHEVKNYLEKHAESYDQDRLELLFRITKLKTSVVATKNEAVKREEEYINHALATIDKEMKANRDLIKKDIFAVYADFKHFTSNRKYNLDYISQLYISHYPKYIDKNEGSFDGFGYYAKEKTSYTLESDIASIDNDGFIKSHYDLSTIFDLVERRQEVEEILSLVERVEYVLSEKNHTIISGSSKYMLDYDASVIVAQDLIKYCQVLIMKYEKSLTQLNYYELEDRIDSSK